MKKIAHIEDNEVDFLIFKQALKDECELHHFHDLEDFFKSEETFDLIVSDLGLKNTFGFETIDTLKKKFPETPIIILTGTAGAFMTGDLIKSLIDKGVQNVISKDIFASKEVTSVIKKIILKKTGEMK